jgi:glycine/D-amino acid oxidase-like deaminating enzyme
MVIANVRHVLADSVWAATANAAPDRPALTGTVEADCVIIGAGFTGLSAALHLAQTGQSVVVLEAETPGWGASGRNGGQVNPGLKDSPDVIEARFGAQIGRRMVQMSGGSADLVFDLITQHKIQCDAQRSGWIRAAHTPKALADLQKMGAEWRKRGVVVDPLNADETENLLGSRDYVGAVIDRRGGNLHPLNYALGLAEAAESQGAHIHGDSRVTGLETTPENVVVTTAQGHVTAKKVLVCTNAYTGDLGQPLGRTVMPVTSVQVATAPLSDNIAQSILPDGHSVSDTRRLLLYFRKDAAERFMIGGRGAFKDSGIRARQADLRATAERLYPQLQGVEWAHAWGGSVALTRDHTPGLHLLAPDIMTGLGYNGRGVGMATAMGKVLAAWAAGCPEDDLDFPITPAQPMLFHRFRNIGLGPAVAASRLLDRMGV